jgi:hypothetical protein
MRPTVYAIWISDATHVASDIDDSHTLSSLVDDGERVRGPLPDLLKEVGFVVQALAPA